MVCPSVGLEEYVLLYVNRTGIREKTMILGTKLILLIQLHAYVRLASLPLNVTHSVTHMRYLTF